MPKRAGNAKVTIQGIPYIQLSIVGFPNAHIRNFRRGRVFAIYLAEVHS